MRILTEPFKRFVTVSEKGYPVNTDFRVWLKIHHLVSAGDFESITNALILCYKGGVLPPSFFEAVEGMWAFLAGEEKKKPCKKGQPEARLFDFEQDAELIYASFLYDYGIDLQEADMHWHKFLILFKNLSQNSPFMRVVSLRSMDLSTIKDDKLRREIRKKQRFFALDQRQSEAEFQRNLELLM